MKLVYSNLQFYPSLRTPRRRKCLRQLQALKHTVRSLAFLDSSRFPQCSSSDVRFPTSLTGDGTDAMNTDCDYSSAYVTLLTSSDLVGHGMTFTIGRGNDIVCAAIREVASRLEGKNVEDLFSNMGKTWDYLCADPQLRW